MEKEERRYMYKVIMSVLMVKYNILFWEMNMYKFLFYGWFFIFFDLLFEFDFFGIERIYGEVWERLYYMKCFWGYLIFYRYIW